MRRVEDSVLPDDTAPLEFTDGRIQLVCLWCGPVSLLLFVVGFWLVGGLVPPPSASDTAAQIAAFHGTTPTSCGSGSSCCRVR